tara:strand:- start:475 stop:831 length:357 start_codon:yes stop_codon:yes gene_type:complete
LDRIWLTAGQNQRLNLIFDINYKNLFNLSPFLQNMANTKSALKYIRKTESRTLANRQIKSRIKTLAKQVKSAANSDDKDSLIEKSRLFISTLDKAAKSGLVHKNKIARHKSECAKLIA